MLSKDSDRNAPPMAKAGRTLAGDAVEAVVADAEAFVEAEELDRKLSMRLLVVVEEVVRNAVLHGHPDPQSHISWSLEMTSSGIRLRFTDCGTPFDPRRDRDKGHAISAVEDRREGGLGWELILAWCRILGYRYEEGENRLELLLCLGTED